MFDSGKGAGFEAKAADITNATNPQQLAQSQQQTQQGLGQQQAFLQALQGQNGIGNQSSVFNQLQNVASGQGPNPAQTALANATGQNVQQQAALMGSQRGTGANAGMLARQAASQGANTQQQAAGQAANMQANQSLGALNQMGGIAGQQVNQQAGALQNYNQFAQNNQAAQMNAQNAFNQNNVSMQSNMNNANANIAAGNQKAQGDLLGGVMSGVGNAVSAVAMSDERAKKNVSNGGAQVQQFLDNTGAHQYEYKDPSQPGASPGTHISPMAQELEKSQLGRPLVQNTPNGKMVDYAKAAPVMMAALAQINERLNAMEGKKSDAPRKMAEGGMTQVSDQGAQAQIGGLGPVADMSGIRKGTDALMGSLQGAMAGGMSKPDTGTTDATMDSVKGSSPMLSGNAAPVPGQAGLMGRGGPSSLLGGKDMAAQLGGGMPAGLGAGAMIPPVPSDERVKKNIKDAPPIKMSNGKMVPLTPEQQAANMQYFEDMAKQRGGWNESLRQELAYARKQGMVGAPAPVAPMQREQPVKMYDDRIPDRIPGQRINVMGGQDNKAAGPMGVSANKMAEVQADQAHLRPMPAKAAPLPVGFAQGGQAKSYVGERLKNGGHVPGKAKHAGDNYKNDTVKALLSPGEIVLPRSVVTGPNAPAKAAKFVAAILAKQGLKRKP
jgi:hypothetical protein